MLAPPHPDTMKNIRSLVPAPLLSSNALNYMVQDLSEEIQGDYEFSLRKAIGELFFQNIFKFNFLIIVWMAYI